LISIWSNLAEVLIMKKPATYFVRGLLFLVPLVATIYVVYWVFTAIDGGIQQLIAEISHQSVQPQWWVTGLGVVILIMVIMVVGFLSSLFITRPLMQLVEKLFARLPLIKLLYSSVKDLVGAFVGEKKKFNQPVLVTLLEGSQAKAVGFITRKSMEFLGLEDEVAVYFPQSYNFAGSLLIVPRGQVKPIDADSSDVMAFIVSGGISGTKDQKQDQNKS